MLKVAIFNFKGGTGKSTTAINLGACLATNKRKVLLIDLDGQRTASFGLGLDGSQPTALDFLAGEKVEPIQTSVKNLLLIPGDLDLFDLETDADLFTPALAKLNGFDVCLMDCSPGLGVASVQAMLRGDRILIPVICEPAVLKGLSEAVQLIRDERPEVPIDVLRCRYRSRLVVTKEADELLAEAAPELDYRLLKTVVPENIAVAEAIAHSSPVTVYSSRSAGAKAYKALARECVGEWEFVVSSS
jgi:chromosome partitioning protein